MCRDLVSPNPSKEEGGPSTHSNITLLSVRKVYLHKTFIWERGEEEDFRDLAGLNLLFIYSRVN